MKDTIKHTYLAADFGGGSGRIIAGFLLNDRLELEEIYRFSNRQVKLGNHIYWDFPALFEDMKTGLKLAAQKGYAVKGIGIDTWGVDFHVRDGRPCRCRKSSARVRHSTESSGEGSDCASGAIRHSV